MVGRISTNQVFDRAIRGVLENQADISKIQQQLASGKRILEPSDDPVGAAKVVRLTEEIDLIEQYKRNNNLLRNSLETEEAVLRNVTDSVNRARTLALQAGNGVLAGPDRKAIAIEIGQIRDQVFDLMNARNAQGEYIFAGFDKETPAFEFNPGAAGNKYVFAGDTGINRIKVSDNVALQKHSNGREVFEDVFARFKANVTGTTGGATASVQVAQQGEFDSFFNANYDPVTPANNNFRVTVNGAGNQVQIDNVGTGATLTTIPFTSGEPFTFRGLEFNIAAAPGETVDFTLAQPEKKNIAETLNDLFNALNDDTASPTAIQESISDALVGLDNGLESVSQATASIGGRINVAQSVFESNLDLEIANREARSNIEDVDYAEAVSELSKQETALQAAQATFARVTGLSLFDFL